MTPEHWQEVDQLFQAAIELRPEERASFLDQACAGDKSLRSEVEALIASDEHGLSFIEDPAFEMAANLLVNNKPELADTLSPPSSSTVKLCVSTCEVQS